MPKEIVTAETNLNGKKARKSPVPANADRITEGALNLNLKERIKLRNVLIESITNELNEMERQFKEGVDLLNNKEPVR